MPKMLFYRTGLMIEQKENAIRIIRAMLIGLIPKRNIWAANLAREMREKYHDKINACAGLYNILDIE